ncbi:MULTISPECIES: SURF1 family protein [unclassified Phenylobacterium]|uniref:SURF1 family protein n=1 Tax=unclassified Phenylobacterium TaxID=2640670 RepID=UPI0022B3B9BA|nr:SURF1 family protein [Phenylobacterium sp. NIBR 498073]WGU41994.1 SURF1 family protein [Phenylobacterium sp. NIBR 498073]
MTRRLFALVCLLLAAGFAALGVWQLERRAWKLDLIARVEARIHAPPRLLTDLSGLSDADAYRRVRLRGAFQNDRETLVQALTERGAGWWVMTPLRTPAGTVLVNRGFVPALYRDPATRPPPSGTVEVTGLLRASEPGGGFLRSNDPGSGRWYSRDVAAIARAHGLGEVAPVFIDAEATPGAGYPVGGLTVVAFRNAHLVYALTWFGLAALSLAGAAIVWRSGATSQGQTARTPAV